MDFFARLPGAFIFHSPARAEIPSGSLPAVDHTMVVTHRTLPVDDFTLDLPFDASLTPLPSGPAPTLDPRVIEAIGDEMKGKRFTEEQIIGILNEAEQTENIRESSKRNNITETTSYRWRSKFGSMEFARVMPSRTSWRNAYSSRLPTCPDRCSAIRGAPRMEDRRADRDPTGSVSVPVQVQRAACASVGDPERRAA